MIQRCQGDGLIPAEYNVWMSYRLHKNQLTKRGLDGVETSLQFLETCFPTNTKAPVRTNVGSRAIPQNGEVVPVYSPEKGYPTQDETENLDSEERHHAQRKTAGGLPTNDSEV